VTQPEITAAEQPTHFGPSPFHGGSTTHKGTREQCSGPDCGPAEEAEPEPYTYTDRNMNQLSIGREDAFAAADGESFPVVFSVMDNSACVSAAVYVPLADVEPVIAAIRAAAGKPAGPTVAEMHAAAVGEVRDPIIGLVDDVHMVREQLLAQEARAATLDRLYRELATAPVDRAAVLRDAADAAQAEGQRLGAEMSGDAGYGARAAAKVIRRLADDAPQAGRPQAEATETSR
jgi:hypothetical protein